MIIRNHI